MKVRLGVLEAARTFNHAGGDGPAPPDNPLRVMDSSHTGQFIAPGKCLTGVAHFLLQRD
jgi:hypothetical protein